MARDQTDRIEVENVKRPGSRYRVDRVKYAAMKGAYLRVLPRKAPGLTVAEVLERLLEVLPAEHFPGGAKAGWWAKAVQLDLEAKGIIVRDNGSPLRLRKLSGG